MLCLTGFELHSRWVPLKKKKNTANKQRKKTDKPQAETLERILFCVSKSVNTIPICF